MFTSYSEGSPSTCSVANFSKWKASAEVGRDAADVVAEMLCFLARADGHGERMDAVAGRADLTRRSGLTRLRDFVAVDIAFTPQVVKATGRDVSASPAQLLFQVKRSPGLLFSSFRFVVDVPLPDSSLAHRGFRPALARLGLPKG